MKLPFWPIPTGYRDIDLGLNRVYQLLERLENPHLKLPPAIHLAGTNGKGSTLAFLKAIFEEKNLKIHSYTSPHLVNFNERIILSGREISDEFLNEILNICKTAAEIAPKIPVTYFEGITVAAFLAFSQVKADVLLLETGMGGRLDATNVLPKVLCSVITPIALDHQEFLGNTLAEIAFEKAGIIKKNCPVIIGKQTPEALKAITSQAKKQNSKIFNYDPSLVTDKISLTGSHQLQNAALAAAAALAQQEFPINHSQIKSALKKAKWPARLQKITSGKLQKTLDKTCDLYLDGGHNLAAATAISDFLKSHPKKQKIIIFAMMADKDYQGFLTEIKDQTNQLITLEITNEPRSAKKETLNKAAQSLKINSITAPNLTSALSLYKNQKNTLTLICGSLYLAGEFLEQNNS